MGDTAAIEQHIKKGADPNEPDTIGLTPMGWAAAAGGVPAAEALMRHGVDVRATDPDGSTALHTAALFGNADMVKFLIKAGADVNAETVLGDTPLSSTEMDELSTILLAEMVGMQVNEEQLPDDREEVILFLKENGGEYGPVDTEEPLAWFYPFVPGMKNLVNQLPMSGQKMVEGIVVIWLLTIFPVFQHLWFLYYLFLLVLGFGFFACKHTREMLYQLSV